MADIDIESPGGDEADLKAALRPLVDLGVDAASDVAPTPAVVRGGNAYAGATGDNVSGAPLYLCGGIGQRFFTVVDWTQVSGAEVEVRSNGADELADVTEGDTWTAETSNAVTASNIADAINAATAGLAEAVGDLVYITPPATARTLLATTDSDPSGMTATNGADGPISTGDQTILGNGAGVGNTAISGLTIIGRSSGTNNSGGGVMIGDSTATDNSGGGVMIGNGAAQSNEGMNVVLIGDSAGQRNSGNTCTIIGDGAGIDNSFDNAVILGDSAVALADNTVQIGDSNVTTIRAGTAKALAALPSASTVGAGARAFVSDSNATLAAGIGNTVASGGANFVPVYSDGTNWKIG